MLSVLTELLAYAAFVVAGWLISPVLGLSVLGAALWWTAQAMDGAKVKVPKITVPRIRVKARKAAVPSVPAPGTRAQ
jgi:hypothetical protein